MAPTTAGILAVVWTLTSVALVLTAGRYLIRWRTRHEFFIDDLIHGISVCVLLAWAIQGTIFFPIIPYWLGVLSGKTPRPDDFESGFLRYRRLQVTGSFLVWIILWLVKFTFLSLYRLIFRVSRSFMRAWWIVVAVTFVTFWVPIAGVLTTCGPTQGIFNLEVCSHYSHYDQTVLIYSCVVNVFTDLMIMILPSAMLYQLQMRATQKLGLVLVFALALITVAFDIYRTYESVVGVLYTSPALYTALEVGFSVIVACLPVYRGLIGIERKIRPPLYLDVGLPPQGAGDAQPLRDRKASNATSNILTTPRHGSRAGNGVTQQDDLPTTAENVEMIPTRREQFEEA